jgi:hypothetical protein
MDKMEAKAGKRILHLTIKKKWFDLIASGEKNIEYREAKPYWDKRLCQDNGLTKTFDEVHFKNGYNKKCPFMRIVFSGIIYTSLNFHKPTQGEKLKTRRFYAIVLGEILEIRKHNSTVARG